MTTGDKHTFPKTMRIDVCKAVVQDYVREVAGQGEEDEDEEEEEGEEEDEDKDEDESEDKNDDEKEGASEHDEVKKVEGEGNKEFHRSVECLSLIHI